MENFFTETNLTALREMALRHTAHEVEEKLGALPDAEIPSSGRSEKILICLTGRPSSAILIRRGKRVADYLRAGCLAVHVRTSAQHDENVERHLSFARNLRIETHVLESGDIPRAIAEFARSKRITQIFMGRSLPQPWWLGFRETVVQKVVRQARDFQITIV